MSSLLCSLLLWLMVWVVPTTEVRGGGGGDADGGEEFGGPVGGSWSQVGRMVGQVVEHHLAGCHLLLATTTTDHTTVFPSLLRQLMAGGHAGRIVEAANMFSQDQPTQDRILQDLWGDARATCRALILYMGTSGGPSAVRFLKASGLWQQPDTTTVVVGGRRAVKTIVHHAGLRNTIHVILLALDVAPPISPVQTLLRKGTLEKGLERVRLYRRCLYCNDGQMGVQLVLPSGVQWHNLLPEEPENFMGHTFKVVTLEYFPFIAYRRNTEDPSGPLTPLDSLDTRILSTIAAHLNFTYEMREPWDGTWGVPLAGGNWSGIVGTLQHEEADFSLNLTPSPARMQDIAHSIIYSRDPLLILSLKPGTLPRHLALMRPFANDLWMIIMACTLSSGVILWLLQRAWSWVSGEPIFRLDSALLQTLGVLLEEPADDPPANISGQVFVGWWWLACVIIDTGYKSSLVAHLSVQTMFPPINTFEDILNRHNWAWGIQPLSGTTFLYFNQSSDHVIQEIYKHFQFHQLQEGVEQVLAGGFSYVSLKSYLRIGTESRYRDRYGITPFHLSTTDYSILGGNSWGFRQGLPVTGQIGRLKQRLIEAGLIDRWTDDVIEIKVRHNRAMRGGEDEMVYSKVDEGQVVLGLDHLQGVFYLLLLGYVVAFLTFLGESVGRQWTRFQHPHIKGRTET